MNKKILTKVSSSILVFAMAVVMLVASILPAYGETAGEIKQLYNVDTNYQQYLDNSVIYKLPDTIEDDQEISVIITVDVINLMDAYEKTDKSVPFSEYVLSGEEAGKIQQQIRTEKARILAKLDEQKIAYTVGEEYNVILSGFEIMIKAADFDVTCKSLGKGEGVIVEGIDNCLVKLSKCCSPIPGDDVIGFITRGHGVSVHKRDCPNVPSDIAASDDRERWIKVNWEENARQSGFNATLAIYCIDRMSLLADVSVALSNMHVMIHNVNTRYSKNGSNVIYMTIAVNNSEHLKGIIAKLVKINGILSIERSGS